VQKRASRGVSTAHREDTLAIRRKSHKITTMLTALVLLLAVFAAPNPVPASAAPAPPSQLKEIGHVESLSVCSAIVVHANSAIGAALDNDRDLALTINRLRTTDLDTDNAIARRNGMNDLATLAGRMRFAAAAGTAEIKRLRAMDARTADPTRKAELKAFADALSGAIVRQHKAATDLDAVLAIIDGRRAVEEMNTPELTAQRASIAGPERVDALDREAGVIRNPVAGPGPLHANDMLHAAADDFASRSQAILGDEGVAADHALGATTGC
jgi:hypothetical protein